MNEVGEIYERPWGTYRTIEQNKFYQLKQIIVNPHKRLSLQRHKYRSEHWIITEGTGIATVNNIEKSVSENQTVHIPKTATHRMSNDSDKPLEFIEVQIGDYLGEDDIERLEDDFGRV